jgi:hypothetical protein
MPPWIEVKVSSADHTPYYTAECHRIIETAYGEVTLITRASSEDMDAAILSCKRRGKKIRKILKAR